jgi:hypothetical protein
MKPFLYALTVSLSLILACSDSDNLINNRKPVKFGSTVRAVPGEIIIFGETVTGLAVEVKSISDSRCPSDAVCFWEGYVTVDFLVGPQKESVSLCLHQNLPDCKKEGNVILEGTTYTITLLSVSPATNSNEKQVVEFQVK